MHVLLEKGWTKLYRNTGQTIMTLLCLVLTLLLMMLLLSCMVLWILKLKMTHDVDRDTELIKYLTQTNVSSSPQSMARTKQTARKTTSDGTLPATPVTTTGNNKSTPTPALQSPGGQNLAIFP